MINVIVSKKRTIKVSTNATAGIIDTSPPITLKNIPVLGGGAFTNGSSIEVKDFKITGAFTVNNSNGQPYYFLKTNGNTTYWSVGNDFITGDYGTIPNIYDDLGVLILDHLYDCNSIGPLITIDLEINV